MYATLYTKLVLNMENEGLTKSKVIHVRKKDNDQSNDVFLLGHNILYYVRIQVSRHIFLQIFRFYVS